MVRFEFGEVKESLRTLRRSGLQVFLMQSCVLIDSDVKQSSWSSRDSLTTMFYPTFLDELH